MRELLAAGLAHNERTVGGLWLAADGDPNVAGLLRSTGIVSDTLGGPVRARRATVSAALGGLVLARTVSAGDSGRGHDGENDDGGGRFHTHKLSESGDGGDDVLHPGMESTSESDDGSVCDFLSLPGPRRA